MSIETIIEGIIRREGGYVDHPDDRGGPTNWGITQVVARAWGFAGDMRTLTQDQARAIYRDRYWIQPGFDKVAALAPDLAEKLADIGVNMGQAVAGKFLQRALNHLNRQGADFPDISVDGGVGKMTIFALEQFLAKRGAGGQQMLIEMAEAQQRVRYMEITEGNQSQETFAFGWQNRAAMA